MNRSVKEVAKISGVSVRTLHYYDQIGLLKPKSTTEAGYRLYDEEDLQTLQQILFFRELDFELKKIKEIITNSTFNREDALQKHKQLLILKKERIENLINLVDETLKGAKNMSFKEFDMTQIEEAQKKYQKEAEERWGGTDAYKESAKKTSSYSKQDWAIITTEAEGIYKALAEIRDESPENSEAQELVRQWQQHITKYYYNCSKDILAGLGEMYIADERFTKNIDKYGEGLALFMSKAIKYYCG